MCFRFQSRSAKASRGHSVGCVGYPAEVQTERLDLAPMARADADELFPIFNDPAGWWYEPDGRHQSELVTIEFVARAALRWDEHGLSYWTVRLRADRTVIGAGGVQRHRSGAWNLSYRIAVAHQGRGYALELGRAALAAAGHADPGVPVIAFVAPHNAPSRRVAERLGLHDQGLRVDANDGGARLAYADRTLDDALVPPADAAG